MKSEFEIKEKLYVYVKELEKHKENPSKYEESFTELLEQMVVLLEWILK